MAGIIHYRGAAVALAALLALALPGCQRARQVNRANYDKITTGMTLAEVETLLGGKGEENPEGLGLAEGSSVAGAAGIGGDLQSMTQRKSPITWYKWGNASRWIAVAFLDGKVAASNFKKAEGLP
jgi:hypothetical protein